MEIVISLMLLFIGIGVLVVIHACVVGRTIRQAGLFPDHTMRGGDPAQAGSTSMSREDIDKLPCFDFDQLRRTGSRSPGVDCAVCLESFKAGEKCRVLPLCNHRFHRDCVDTWLLRTPLCPICRAGLKAVGVDNNNNNNVGESGIGGIQTGRVREEGDNFPVTQTGH